MTEQNQKPLGTTLWSIADQLRGAMKADDFCDYMFSLNYLALALDMLRAGDTLVVWKVSRYWAVCGSRTISISLPVRDVKIAASRLRLSWMPMVAMFNSLSETLH
jgi:hypothetical protein